MSNPIKAAVEQIGSQRALAEALQVSPSFISQCVSGYRKMPLEHCKRIEELTGGTITKAQIRPDIYEDAASTEAAA